MTEDITIQLPSLIRRIGGEKAKQAREIALQYQCDVKRVRRSRNWAITGEAISIQSFIERLKTDNDAGFGYLIQKIATALLGHADKLEPLDIKLRRLIRENPNLTLGELIQLTQCTLAEARVARFDVDC
ncbi:ribosome recycling factor family protein [Shewanella sp. SR43-8]|uniref:ribosome recycling factor family protein n=1 Tax=Shewanella sp. SR43-8 TaxID=2760938 RepID=UPI0016028305|nr:ribosome recycling factor family protein [Shewanella sp. SR43-8]MBB1321531.1 ribosome recycling factor family protein [Shewanella sp. SR43-8]